MKRLILIRHAKSSWANDALSDTDRPLNKRGLRDAPRMGSFLTENAPDLDRIVTSPAVRARSTAELIAAPMGIASGELIERSDLYLASCETLAQTIRGFPDDWECPALVAHNPGLSYLAEYLTDRPFGNIPTCGVLHLSCPVDRWADLQRDSCEILFYQVPRQLAADESS